MDMFQQYKEMYEQELKTREVLYSRLNIPLAIILVLLGLLSFYAKSYRVSGPVSALDRIFVASVFFATTFLVLAIYSFVRSFFRYTYGEIPTADEWENYRENHRRQLEGYERQLEEYYKKYYGSAEVLKAKIEEVIDDATKSRFYTYYQNLSTKNAQNNVKRSAYLHNVTEYLIVAICSYGVSALLYIGTRIIS